MISAKDHGTDCKGSELSEDILRPGSWLKTASKSNNFAIVFSPFVFGFIYNCL